MEFESEIVCQSYVLVCHQVVKTYFSNTWPCCKPICYIIRPKHLYFSNLGYLMPDLRVSAMKKSEIWPFWRNHE